MAFTIKVNADKLKRQLSQFDFNQKVTRPSLWDADRFAVAGLKLYPPPRQYRRTFALQKGWNGNLVFATSGSVMRAARVNNTMYAHLVQGAKTQAKIHKGYWNNTEDVIARRTQEYLNQKAEGIAQTALDKYFQN